MYPPNWVLKCSEQFADTNQAIQIKRPNRMLMLLIVKEVMAFPLESILYQCDKPMMLWLPDKLD